MGKRHWPADISGRLAEVPKGPLKFKSMKRGLRVTSMDPPTEFTLDFRLWDAIAAAKKEAPLPRKPTKYAAGLKSLGFKPPSPPPAKYLMEVEGGRAQSRGLAKWSQGLRVLTELGERVKAQMPPPPPLADRPAPIESKVPPPVELKLDARDIALLRAWRADFSRAIPIGKADYEEDAWFIAAGKARTVTRLLQLGMVEPGVADIAWDAAQSRATPVGRRAAKIVWRRTAAAKLAFA